MSEFTLEQGGLGAVHGFGDGEHYLPLQSLHIGKQLLEEGWKITHRYYCTKDTEFPQKALLSELSNEVKSNIGDEAIIGPIIGAFVVQIGGAGKTKESIRLYHGAALWEKKVTGI